MENKPGKQMFIDYLTVILLNQVAGLFILCMWATFDFGQERQRRWIPGLLMSGAVSLAAGAHMAATWPLPGSFNILFGEMGVFFGILLLGLALVLHTRGELLVIALYAAVAGFGAVLYGVQVFLGGLTHYPILIGAGFVWLGIVGILSPFGLWLMERGGFRVLALLAFGVASLLWAVITASTYWGHLAPFSAWQPGGG